MLAPVHSAQAARRPIVSAPRRPIGVPWKVFGQSFGCSFGGAIVVAASCAPALSESPAYVPVLIFLAGWLLSATFMGLGPMRRAARTFVAVDEGGVRCRLGPFSTYWPFALVGEGSIEDGTLIVPVLILRDRSGNPFVRLPLIGPLARQDGVELIEAYEARRSQVAPDPPVSTAALERQGRDLPTWAAAIDALVRQVSGPGYRNVVVDFDALLALLGDMRYSADLRAGAAHALLRGAPPETRAAARALLREESPPIVSAMAMLAGRDAGAPSSPEPTGALAPASPPPGLEKGRPFLDPEDRAAL